MNKREIEVNTELTDLLKAFREANIKNVKSGVAFVERHFEKVDWSLLKSEWLDLNTDERHSLVSLLMKRCA